MKEIVIAVCAVVTVAASAAFGDSLGNIGDVRLKGYLGERLDAMIANHVAAQDVDYVTAPFMEKTERRGVVADRVLGQVDAFCRPVPAVRDECKM